MTASAPCWRAMAALAAGIAPRTGAAELRLDTAGGDLWWAASRFTVRPTLMLGPRLVWHAGADRRLELRYLVGAPDYGGVVLTVIRTVGP